MLRSFSFLSAALLLLLCACGPPSSTDPAAKDQKLVLYDYENAEKFTDEELELVAQNVAQLRTSLEELRTSVAAMPDDYPSVASGETESTEQRAGGTERMQDMPDRGANVGTTFDSITSYNRDLLGGARKLASDADNFFVEANQQINEARAQFVLAKAENDWSDAAAAEWEAPITRAENALAETMRFRESLRELVLD